MGILEMQQRLNLARNQVALAIALLFHVSGVIGMFTAYRQWFIDHTPLNLSLMALLLLWTQPQKNAAFFVFAAIAFATGMLAEITGVATGYLFGAYVYGNTMGPQWKGVPLLIGINWLVVVYCAGVVMHLLQGKVAQQYAARKMRLPGRLQAVTFVLDGALLVTFFDWIMEPAAIRLGLWKWLQDGSIPLYNYVCWFFISLLLLCVFRLLPFRRDNHFAVHLLIIQVLFFIVIRTFA